MWKGQGQPRELQAQAPLSSPALAGSVSQPCIFLCLFNAIIHVSSFIRAENAPSSRGIRICTYAEMHTWIWATPASLRRSAQRLVIRVQIFSSSVSGRQRGHGRSVGASCTSRWVSLPGEEGDRDRLQHWQTPSCPSVTGAGCCRWEGQFLNGKLLVGTFPFRKALVTQGHLLGFAKAIFQNLDAFSFCISNTFIFLILLLHEHITDFF